MRIRNIIIALVVVAGLAGGGWYWWQSQQDRLPDDIAIGNGRIEAEEVHVATKYPGRVVEVLAKALAQLPEQGLQVDAVRGEADPHRSIRHVLRHGASGTEAQSNREHGAHQLTA